MVTRGGTEALAFFVLLPGLAWVLDVLLLRSAYEAARTDLTARNLKPPVSRLYVLVAHGIFPLVLGLVLWSISSPLIARIDIGSRPGYAALRLLVVWSAVAYGIASTIASASQTVILRTRIQSLLGADFGRVLPIFVLPFAGTVYAVTLAFLVLGRVDTATSPGPLPSTSSVETVVAALQAFAVATLGFLAGAVASNRIQDLSLRGFQRVLLISVAGEFPAVRGLVWAFLAIGKL